MKTYLWLATAVAPFMATQAIAAPDISSCPTPDDLEDSTFDAKKPATLDPAFAGVAVTDGKNLAVSTLSDATFCDPVHWVFSLKDPGFLMSQRFIGMKWYGLEADGYLLIDRAGKGGVVDTGRRPAFSDSVMRMASIQFSGAGWGGLEALAIWDVTEKGLKEIYRRPNDDSETALPNSYTDFRIDSFVGQSCLRISAISNDEYRQRAEDGSDIAYADRTEFYAREDQGWVINKGLSTGCLDD